MSAEIVVIIPAYNAESTIQRTIQSVQAQTYSDWEIILINDGSTDQTVERVKAINDERIKLYTFENAGQAAARNRGIQLSSHEFLAFLDADDLWTTDKLESQRKALIAFPQAGLAYSWTVILDEEGFVQHRQKEVYFDGDVLQELLKENFIFCGSTPLMRREAVEAVGYFDTRLTPVEDWDYWLRVAAEYPFAVVPKYQTFYCKSSNSSSSAVNRLNEQLFRVIEKAYTAAPEMLQYGKNQTLANAHYYLASQYLNYKTDRDGLKQARNNFFIALRLNPSLTLNFDTHFLGTKLVLMFLLPHKWVDRCVHYYRKLRARLYNTI